MKRSRKNDRNQQSISEFLKVKANETPSRNPADLTNVRLNEESNVLNKNSSHCCEFENKFYEVNTECKQLKKELNTKNALIKALTKKSIALTI